MVLLEDLGFIPGGGGGGARYAGRLVRILTGSIIAMSELKARKDVRGTSSGLAGVHENAGAMRTRGPACQVLLSSSRRASA